jgi:predicted Fe-Mo cluster-binding NifX family protein
MITAKEDSIDSLVDERFGRAPWLIKYDTDSLQWEAHKNPGFTQSGGAGVAAAQFVIDNNVNSVISGDFGPHAANAFRAANISMHKFIDGGSTVKKVVDNFQSGKSVTV